MSFQEWEGYHSHEIMQNGIWKQEDRQGGRFYSLCHHPRLQGVIHAFSTRRGGVSPPPFDSLNFSTSTGDLPARVQANREALLQSLDAGEACLHTLRQVHSTRVRRVQADDPITLPPPEGDALVTTCPGHFLGVLTADCCPILIASPEERVVAAIHAGWKGSGDGIGPTCLDAMKEAGACHPERMLVLIGPTIGPCCYQVGEEVREAFVSRHPFSEAHFAVDPAGRPRTPRWKLDLPAFHRQLLVRCGIPEENIYTLSLCTRCHPQLFFSYRRDGAVTGRMLSLIGLA